VRVVSFLRNFGKAAALAAGFERARGEVIVTMDADLQDDPAELPRFLEAIAGGAHLVSGWKKDRQDPFSRRAASKVFNTVTRALTGVKVHDMNCGFKAYRRQVISAVPLYGELHRFIPALAAARGFTVNEIIVRHHPRQHGRSRYGLERIPRGFFDLLTVLFLTSYARRPLHLFGGLGLMIGALGAIALAYLTGLWFLGEHPIGTRPLFLGGIMLLLLGAQLLSLGLVSELIAHRTTRPSDHYIVAEEL
jgi:glycosyltransferase involved in cell wall biosynthesis